MSSRRAFTLIELLVVMALIGSVAVLVVPRLSASQGHAALRDQALRIVALARRARARALTEGRAYQVMLERDGEVWTARLGRARDSLAAPEGDDPELEPADEADAWSRPVAFFDQVTVERLEQNDEDVPLEEVVVVAFDPLGETETLRVVLARGDDELAVDFVGPLGVATLGEVEE